VVASAAAAAAAAHHVLQALDLVVQLLLPRISLSAPHGHALPSPELVLQAVELQAAGGEARGGAGEPAGRAAAASCSWRRGAALTVSLTSSFTM
jgi:hypothetical protein